MTNHAQDHPQIEPSIGWLKRIRRPDAATLAVGSVAVVCATALAISVVPGALDQLLLIALFVGFTMMMLLSVPAIIAIIVLVWLGKLRIPETIPVRPALRIVAILAITYGLLEFYVPRRVAFMASRSAFTQMAPSAPASLIGGAELNRWVGLYRVDKWARDERGGTYFRVFTGSDGIGPDQMSYGFAYQPNRDGTPFGSAHYRLHRLGDDWYWFRVSDDW